jgi:hypothetical protein
MAGIKKLFMMHLWRIQQIQAIITALFWSATIAGVFFQYLQPWMVSWGIIKSGQVGLGLLILFLIVLSVITIFGYLYDVFLKMWIQMNVVTIERDIYARTKQSAKEIIQWQYYHIPILRAVGRKHEAEYYEKWNEHCMEDDAHLRKDVYEVIDWVNSYELRSKKDRWLKDIKSDFWKNIDDDEYKKWEKEIGSD